MDGAEMLDIYIYIYNTSTAISKPWEEIAKRSDSLILQKCFLVPISTGSVLAFRPLQLTNRGKRPANVSHVAES